MGLTPRAVEPYVLSNPGDVAELLRTIPLLGFRPRGRLSVRVPAMDPGIQRGWERRLGFWLDACGCQAGALLAVSALVWRISVILHESPHTWGAVLAHVGWVLGAAVVGKVAGLAIARVLLVLDLKRLSRQMSARSAVPSEVRP